ncbi:hypothetical protein PPL_07585 [Heterostelium album PN500]|uniref:Uncharacterized protein n=1 Tax=Heterostelium pallidum (strain ATCC 26659 / Pp 5 / PN500) TaxID=670386 RepID=D3BGD4_HETP5|nr:hypothetical protein PPL_07585 [Heterostelium album PN500]EFA79534.1 hypothetical protein PPL_07585 [Heterostelium album PN500]|eukprot:XP_020431655.1 hypothetical protein PPL_07585 [Heterostelium album PN500]
MLIVTYLRLKKNDNLTGNDAKGLEKFKQLNLVESKDGKECYGVYIDHIKEVQEMVAKYLKDNPKF